MDVRFILMDVRFINIFVCKNKKLNNHFVKEVKIYIQKKVH